MTFTMSEQLKGLAGDESDQWIGLLKEFKKKK